MQDVQVARHAPNQGKPYLFHGLRVLWLSAVCQCREDRVPGPSRQTQQKQNRIGVSHMTRNKSVFSVRLSHVVFFFPTFITDVDLTGIA
jgi:hypothetical protein